MTSAERAALCLAYETVTRQGRVLAGLYEACTVEEISPEDMTAAELATGPTLRAIEAALAGERSTLCLTAEETFLAEQIREHPEEAAHLIIRLKSAAINVNVQAAQAALTEFERTVCHVRLP